ncbi:hypothetical protein [Rhizobium arenae]|uniref:hypothetical protein n=1 Tax=Pararhizobium arenae TaxID=1856850 RepID=UPI0013017023
MAKLFLDIAFVDLDRGGKACAKGIARELEGPLNLAEIAAHAYSHCGPFHAPVDLLVV